jgi:predicted RNA-binding protein YlqC (UPF0109 family)
MKDLLEFLAKSLVEHPDQVVVKEIEIEQGGAILFELSVAPEDMGKVIGKQGKIAKSIRTLVKAKATKEGRKVSVEIL